MPADTISVSSSTSCHGFVEVYSDATLWKNAECASDSKEWTNALEILFSGIPCDILKNVEAICASGTSASCVLVNKKTGQPTRGGIARMYNYDVISSSCPSSSDFGMQAMKKLNKFAPTSHTATARTSSLAKLLSWNEEEGLMKEDEILAHQADYLLLYLTTTGMEQNSYEVISDWHNCLKLGYDVRNLEWPQWLKECLLSCGIEPDSVLPKKVTSPGTNIGPISRVLSERFGINPEAQIVTATTDSNAAFFAAAGTKPTFGTAVTSLGSTLAMKVLSKSFCEDSQLGVYSHRFPLFSKNTDGQGEAWLVGGASNSGCAVLRKLEFSNEELVELSSNIDWSINSSLNYYPLCDRGERFPVADSDKEPSLEPVPKSREEFLHGILQGITNIEVQGFSTLGDLGMEPKLPKSVLTCGGGSKNLGWQKMRQRKLSELAELRELPQVKVSRAISTEASFGAAILAAVNNT